MRGCPTATGASPERTTMGTERWTDRYRLRARRPTGLPAAVPSARLRNAGQLPAIERRGISYREDLKTGGTGPRKTRYQRRDEDP
jgi:hypothetical protein